MTPLILFVGFLGAGKTTYLRNLLPLLTQQGITSHVIINDYQNARVDAALLKEHADAIVPITGSCVCCGSRQELLKILQGFVHEPGKVVLIETNGTTDSEGLIELLSLAPELEHFSQPIQISIIDGKRWQKRLWHNPLELDQAKTANYLFVSRLDEITTERRLKVEKSLQSHGLPLDSLTPSKLASLASKLSRELGEVSSRSDLAQGRSENAPQTPQEKGASTHRHDTHAQHHFASYQIPLPEVISREKLTKFLKSLPGNVIRAKGVVQFVESPQEFSVFQKVDKFDQIQYFPIQKPTENLKPVCILIGPSISELEVRVSAAATLW